MDLFFDADSKQRLQSTKFNSAATDNVTAKLQSTEQVRVQWSRNAVPCAAPGGTPIKIGLKPEAHFSDTAFDVYTDTFTAPTDPTLPDAFYTASLLIDSVPLRALFPVASDGTSPAAVNLIAEVKSGSWTSQTFAFTAQNNVIKNTESPAVAIPGASGYPAPESIFLQDDPRLVYAKAPHRISGVDWNAVANTASPGAGGDLFGGWLDTYGKFSVFDGALLCGIIDAGDITRFLLRPSAENAINQRLVMDLRTDFGAGNPGGNTPYAAIALRVQSSGAHYKFALASSTVGDVSIYAVDASGTMTTIKAYTLLDGYDRTHAYSMDAEAIGTNSTILSLRITDLTTGALVLSDIIPGQNQAGLQQAGSSGVCNFNFSCYVSAIRTYATDNSGGVVVFIGTSMTRSIFATKGIGTITGTTYPAVVMQQLGPNWIGINLGVSGKKLSTLVGEIGALAAAYSMPSKAQLCMVIEGGANDLAMDGITGEANAKLASSVCGIASNAGWDVVRLTMTPSNAIPEFDARRNTSNAIELANSARYCAIVANVAANPFIGQDGQETNTDYYADGTHQYDKALRLQGFDVAKAVQVQAMQRR